jgi:hypothetical protein
MKVSVESYGQPRRDFYDLRSELIELDQKFEAYHLRLLPYDQLHLCCIGNAGDAACSLKLVQQEKIARRERFLAMESEELKTCERFLKAEGMYDDVREAIAALRAPLWDHLNSRQKVWAKLNCLYNHIDNPAQRIGEAVGLMRDCASVTTGGLPLDVAMHYVEKLRALLDGYSTRFSDYHFRQQIEEYRDSVLDFLEENERGIVEREEIKDYHCTSDCFRMLL